MFLAEPRPGFQGIWIKVLIEYVHSDQTASRHISFRGVLVFGVYVSFIEYSYNFGSTSSQRSHVPSFCLIRLADLGSLTDCISSIPQLVHLIRHHGSHRTNNSSWRCRRHFGFRGRAGRTCSMPRLGSDFRSTRSSNSKLLFLLKIRRSEMHGSQEKSPKVLCLCLGSLLPGSCSSGLFEHSAEVARYKVSQHEILSKLVFRTE